jgi:hypothetical protein
MTSAEECRTSCSLREEYDNIIRHTRELAARLSLEQRHRKAKSHIMDALLNRAPRPIYMSSTLSSAYYLFDCLQGSAPWDWLVFLFSYLYMYLVVLEGDHFGLKVGLEAGVLAVFLFDTFIDFYTLSFDHFKRKNKYPPLCFWKLGLLCLMLVDLAVFIALPSALGRPIRPFRILRACTAALT